MYRKRRSWFTFLTTILAFLVPVAQAKREPRSKGAAHSVTLAAPHATTSILLDPADYAVVGLAANLLAGDIDRLSGQKPTMVSMPTANVVIVAGTLGHSRFVDELVRRGLLRHAAEIRGQWEATLTEVVEHPFPGVARALVSAGSDRRGTAYGLTQLSEKLGVSAWNWWADVPVPHRDVVTVPAELAAGFHTNRPGVQYRGIFLNDEDWGLIPWIKATFDPGWGNIGPKTYEKVFELMLRLRLNYFWPAMHGISREFAADPENAALADRYAIVAGASHCEPMLFNNVHWNEKTQGPWDYARNPGPLHEAWRPSAETRGQYEAAWTLGIRGIHDQAMEGPPDISTRRHTVESVFADQRGLLDRFVTRQWGPVTQVFLPYKEVQPIYDAGLQVPPDVTLAWADDNFGYIRRFSSPAERTRPGGAGVYWHISYYGGPHSYTWLNTTAPALMWEELHKAWENGAGRLWVLNVGDLKPGEVGIDFYARLAWDPAGMGADSQPRFLREFVARNLPGAPVNATAQLLAEYFRLGTIRKPELMNRAWAMSLGDAEAFQLSGAYKRLLDREAQLAPKVDPEARDAWTELVGFPARVLARSGQIFLLDRAMQGDSSDAQTREAETAEIEQTRQAIEADVEHYNHDLAGGKWNHMMPGMVTDKDLTRWSSQVRWPWGEAAAAAPQGAGAAEQANASSVEPHWRDAAEATHLAPVDPAQAAAWTAVAGLGTSGNAVAVLPAGLSSSWKPGDPAAPALEYTFTLTDALANVPRAATLQFLPTFRLYPGLKLRVAVSVDHAPPTLVEVPGSDGEDERGRIRSLAVQTNYVRSTVPLPALAAGAHTLRITAVDPGIVLDRVALPE